MPRPRARRAAVAALAAATLAVAALASASGAATASSPASLAASLSPRQLAGQRVIYAYTGLTPPRRLVALIRNGEAAGVIFFTANIRSAAQLRSVAASLQAAARQSPVKAPLLLMTDQEGGLVRRLAGAPTLSEKQIGASANAAALASAAGAGAAATLRAAGLNVDLAPVLDVFRTPGDFIDRYQRSYSSSPSVAGQLGAAFITAAQRGGIAATAKHFPGLGAAATAQDTDLVAVTLPVSLGTLRAVDEQPYASAIAAGVRLVMLSWARYPSLDAKLPAGLSSAIVQGELRTRLRFRGVTITDSIGAGALKAFGGDAQRGALAARAGDDLILADSMSGGEGVLGGLEAALAKGTITRIAAQQAVARVIALRNSL